MRVSTCLRFVSCVFAVCAVGCGGSTEPAGLGAQFDVDALSDEVFRLCDSVGCSDLSESECKFYLRYDILEYALASDDPGMCFDALKTEVSCLADAGSCREDTCQPPAQVCQASSEFSRFKIPEAVEPARVACESRADCDAAPSQQEGDREASITLCQAEHVARTELFFHDYGLPCATAFIDFLVCVGESNVPCRASYEEERSACPEAIGRFEALCGT